jgi:large subunit ribosomal protein L5
MQTINDKLKTSFTELSQKFGYKNSMQSPKIVKVAVSVGVGKIQDKKQKELVADRLAKITGQKPSERGVKKSIASFKVREGDLVGYLITLRGKRALGFVDKLINIILPRMRDFQGISKKVIDNMGNITIGIREHTIFPETADEELRNVFGLAITITTTAKSRDEALAFFEHLAMPFAS